jgi:hypothetical protein
MDVLLALLSLLCETTTDGDDCDRTKLPTGG